MSKVESTVNAFDTLASTWDEDPGKIMFAETVAEKIREEVPLDGGTQAMEFGCGTGLVTLPMAAAVESIVALDSSEKMLGVLNEKICGFRVHNIRTHLLASENERFPGEGFSLVFSNMVLHHVDDYRATLKMFYEALAPGGYVAVSDLDVEDGSFHGDMEGVFHHGFPRDGFLSDLESAGFENCRILTVTEIPMKKDDGKTRPYPVFMAIGQKL